MCGLQLCDDITGVYRWHVCPGVEKGPFPYSFSRLFLLDTNRASHLFMPECLPAPPRERAESESFDKQGSGWHCVHCSTSEFTPLQSGSSDGRQSLHETDVLRHSAVIRFLTTSCRLTEDSSGFPPRRKLVRSILCFWLLSDGLNSNSLKK